MEPRNAYASNEIKIFDLRKQPQPACHLRHRAQNIEIVVKLENDVLAHRHMEMGI